MSLKPLLALALAAAPLPAQSLRPTVTVMPADSASGADRAGALIVSLEHALAAQPGVRWLPLPLERRPLGPRGPLPARYVVTAKIVPVDPDSMAVTWQLVSTMTSEVVWKGELRYAAERADSAAARLTRMIVPAMIQP